MGQLVDITGRTFARLTVLERGPIAAHGECVRWLCRCECGNTKLIIGKLLVKGQTKSCGCIRSEQLGERSRKHGASHTREFYVWQGMKARCNNPKHTAFKDYGGRGIRVCDSWASSFETFRADMGPKPTAQHTLERADNDGPYAPWNCTWGHSPGAAP